MQKQDAQLYVSDGNVDCIRGRAVYFIRNTDQQIDTQKDWDEKLITGEVTSDVLALFEAQLSGIFKPLVDKKENWGKADEKSAHDFTDDLRRFVDDVDEALRNIGSGVELDHPNPQYDLEKVQKEPVKYVQQNPNALRHFESLVESWCDEIEKHVNVTSNSNHGEPGAEIKYNHDYGDAVTDRKGPRGIIEWWRARTQKLTSITEQLAQKEFRAVVTCMTTVVSKGASTGDTNRSSLFSLLRRWKALDVRITEAANEAKDNVKYLSTLDKFLEPLYSQDPSHIIDALPALMNSVKMIHQIARYFGNDKFRMEDLFVRLTYRMIVNCKDYILQAGDSEDDAKTSGTKLWTKDPATLLKSLEECLKLNEAYQDTYRFTKEALASQPNAKKFEFDENAIFGHFDLFCRRVIKLVDMFATIAQFEALASHNLEGMESLTNRFNEMINDFKRKRHDLLAYQDNSFDRDYVEFNVKVQSLEQELQNFINSSFESISDVMQSLRLLKKFQAILQRESLKADLDDKFAIIFQTYGGELEMIQSLYERHKHNPPTPRNMPPVAGNISWSRHLLKRIEEPMREFERNQAVLASRDAKRIIKSYNKVARTLVAFEYLWYQAWVDSIEDAKAGLQATLLIRHPDDGKLYVNFDAEILQLIREAKCLDRMGVEIPESAKVILLQEEKFKSYYNQLAYCLTEYARITSAIIPVTASLLKPHIHDLEYKLRPGMVTLTWTSMNIDAYLTHVQNGLRRLEELVHNINDVIENRVENNLKVVSKAKFVDLPEARTCSLDDFVSAQEEVVFEKVSLLQGKNMEIEHAVEDLTGLICTYPLDAHIERVKDEDIQKLYDHYNHFMYQALLNATKTSLNTLKRRVSGGENSDGNPFFDINVKLSIPSVDLQPSLEEVQEAINRTALAVLGCTQEIYDWGQDELPQEYRVSFFHRVTKDIEVARVVLLLTGSVQSLRDRVNSYLSKLDKYAWLWREDADSSYKEFTQTNPSIEDYEAQLQFFMKVEQEISEIEDTHVIGALHLNTVDMKTQMQQLAEQWKVRYSDNLHKMAKSKMSELSEYSKKGFTKLSRSVDNLDSLKFVMETLQEIRDKEATIEADIAPIMQMYAMLENYLPSEYMDREEMDQKSVLRSNWKKLVNRAEEVKDEISSVQVDFKKQLVHDVRQFKKDVENFRQDYEKNGPMVSGISPQDAMDRLKRYEGEYDILARKKELYQSGEQLFALPITEYPDLENTKKELNLLNKLYGLYRDVMNKMNEYKTILWSEVVDNIDQMSSEMEGFAARCKKMPKRLRDWEAFLDLKAKIEDFQSILPVLYELSKDSIKQRHWDEIRELTGHELHVEDTEFKMQDLIDANLVEHKDDIEEICDAADKQLDIEQKLLEIQEKWSQEPLAFGEWKSRGVPILQRVPLIVEDLEEAQMNLQTMLTMRHVTPFKEEAQDLLKLLSDTSDTLELWQKVQMLWCSLESVFLGGDIAKQMPREASRFQKVDKEWVKLMSAASKTVIVTQACESEVLRQSLPNMYDELERCQKSLEGYLEQKRSLFPRFYFVSNPVLLNILSQGSDPMAIQEYYEKIFDAITRVEHDKKDKSLIVGMLSREGSTEEKMELQNPVKAQGNIENWLTDLLNEMKRTMKEACDECAAGITSIKDNLDALRGFVDGSCGQYALLGLQLLYTATVEEALKQGPKKMREAEHKTVDVLGRLISWCLQDLGSKMNRTKIESLVTIQVHQRDVLHDLVQFGGRSKKPLGVDNFEWLKQIRFYWRPEESDEVSSDGACVVSVTDVEFNYQYEYLGCKERLVITPLTDRCYITLAQALGMHYGGSPAGPAGTGKTETVKDMGRSLGIYVVVTNCSSEMMYTDCAKIFKGLCMGGLWGCFDEFNRITLPVLSVVAQQVLAVLNAKKANARYFNFPGDAQQVNMTHICGFFITMNPGYAGRQELPENLKALFRGVAMMVPDREIIIKVKLCSVGYSDFTNLSRKFFVCYQLCEEQLSKTKHYDFGLRNILSVLRTAGATKRDNLNENEELLLYRTLRDMNLSKFIAQDVPLFLSMLRDLFPSVKSPPKSTYPDVEKAIKESIDNAGLEHHPSWLTKVIQLYETSLVRHGIMLSGPTGGGKSAIFDILSTSLQASTGTQYRLIRMNPKAITSQEMYGETDIMSGEWTTGIFAAIWQKYNNRSNAYNTWLICDGPVDTMWIESLNSVLDDNKLLTLASGDRFPMTENVALMFENENLNNASPATVSRAGIVYVSDTDLDWRPVVNAWIKKQKESLQKVLAPLFTKYVGKQSGVQHEDEEEEYGKGDSSKPHESGHLFEFMARQVERVMEVSRVGAMAAVYRLLGSTLQNAEGKFSPASSDQFAKEVERLFLYSLGWAVGGLLEPQDRKKFDSYLRELAGEAQMPTLEKDDDTIFEFFVDPDNKFGWSRWLPPKWEYPKEQDPLDFSNLLVPTIDSTRSLALLDAMHRKGYPVLMVGGPGTAKTSNALMFCNDFDPEQRLLKRINFSSATDSAIFQAAIEAQLDKRGGKSFGPPGGKKMTVFIDDISMPEINEWGDQPTNEIVRQLIEHGGFYFRDKDKRGDFKICEDLNYVAAMTHPGGGRNDIPTRLKRQFFIFNLVLPSISSIDNLYGQMVRGRFTTDEFDQSTLDVCQKLTEVTIDLWTQIKNKMLPTPAKFHYIFNMRDLSRVFQGILLTPKETIKQGGVSAPCESGALNVIKLWEHESARVFRDKLTTAEDKEWFDKALNKVVRHHFGDDSADAIGSHTDLYFVNFMRDDVYDEEEVLIEEAPLVYEDGGSLQNVRERVEMFMNRHNEQYPSKSLELVLFNDALEHLVRITRILSMARGSALLVGVGGSGKQSLTKLAAYIARSKTFQIVLTKSYNMNALMDDLRYLYKTAGAKQSITFLFTEAEIKKEQFLEYINSILLTGEIGGLFAKDEMMAMSAELRNDFLQKRPGQPDTPDNLQQFFIDTVRDYLHLVLCMSPKNPKFPERARKFPGIISGTTIDWFLPWPEEALVSVAEGMLKNYELDAEGEVKENLVHHMGHVHKMVVDVCDEYFEQLRRHVYQTPKSYLSFIANYKDVYQKRLEEIKEKEQRVNLGLQKLTKGSQDVEDMKVTLAEEREKLEKATAEVNEKLGSLQTSQAEAEKASEKAQRIKENCESEAARIKSEKEQCEKDLAEAQPFVDEANRAISSIKPAHLTEVKRLPKPADIIKVVFDGVLVLFYARIEPVNVAELNISKTTFEFISPSFDRAVQMMADTAFLAKVQNFAKDSITEETIELMTPYVNMEFFDSAVAKSASAAAEGLCVWVRAMKSYHEASKIVKPKLEALKVAEGNLEKANKDLAQAEAQQKEAQDKLAALKKEYDDSMSHAKSIEENERQLRKRMEQAESLIRGLGDEKTRWQEDSATFADRKQKLVGDCAVCCAFVSYCGPFNQPFRSYMTKDRFIKDCKKRGVPVSSDIDVTTFLVDAGITGDWALQGLPTDPLSIQNGILVTFSARYPLLIDPQGQALQWITNKETDRLPPHFQSTTLDHKDLKDQLEYCMQEGRTLIVVGIQEDLDPILDPVLEHEVIKKGKRKYINVADKLMELHDEFRMFFFTRLPNPHFSPELQAKTTVVDFTVTQKGLEDQLLGRVIQREQKELEDLLNQVLEEVNNNTKSLLQLDALLLERLTSGQKNLLDDDELVDVLANTKAKAADVKEKLQSADETRKNINEKREQFRPVATRGSVLYFSIVEMSNVNVMYQTSLSQFIELFMKSMEVAEKAAVAAKRVQKIIESMTYLVYRYVNKGLYEKDKLLFVFIITLKTMVTAGTLTPQDVNLFMRAGAALDINSVRKKPSWITDGNWLNVIALAEECKFFNSLPDTMIKNETMWRKYYEENEPEDVDVPDFEMQLREQKELGHWLRLLLIRSLRVDRALLMVRDFVRQSEEMGPRYVEPVSDTMESILEDMTCLTPVIFLLSTGADPTESIEILCKRRKQVLDCVSMGQGQEPVALKAIQKASVNGSWVLLQNCELGLDLMGKMEDMINDMKDTVHEDFRLFITALPHPHFPLGLLQMSTKVTNEPPSGMQAGLLRSFTTIIDQDRLERIDTSQWRQLVFGLAFLHSVVQERRKFGPLGWCVAYQFNNGDLSASLTFLEKHMYNGPISWPTVQYMVSEVQYGGKITDDFDRRLFNTYAHQWLSPVIFDPDFSYTPKNPISRVDFDYRVKDFTEIDAYRNYASSLPEIDNPEIFGLHPNADLTFRMKEANKFLDAMTETQPKSAGGGAGGGSMEAEVLEKCEELLEKSPDDYVEDDYKADIQRQGGMNIPLNIFLFQEVQRLQKVITKVKDTLTQIKLAINGEVVMTNELQEAMQNVHEAKVPQSWLFTPAGDEFSWLSPTLGMWFNTLVERNLQNSSWLRDGRPYSFWLAGFFNPQGFLTAMKQEVTRKHRNDGWALDDVVYWSDVKDNVDKPDSLRQSAPEGQYIHGLFLDGARYDVHEKGLAESEPKKLFASMPVVRVTAVTKAMFQSNKKELAQQFGNQPYECPVYKYPQRMDKYLIYTMLLPSRQQGPQHWILRGVAITVVLH